MWAVLKIDKKNISHLKSDFLKKLGKDVKFYIPKIKLKKFLKKKIYFKESFLLGDYLLCFHKDFSKISVLTSLQYCKGLKYFLAHFINSQNMVDMLFRTFYSVPLVLQVSRSAGSSNR